jgi:hypothetical protein
MRRRGSIRLRSEAGICGGEVTEPATEVTKMISKNLSRRLERLETTVIATSNPVSIILQFYSPEKVVTRFHVARSRSPCAAIPEKAE